MKPEDFIPFRLLYKYKMEIINLILSESFQFLLL